jgi:CO dehydrogenase maturation factor
MSLSFAITGKGGVGKTTVSSLIVRQLVANGLKPVLAIDADPNSCLDAALGIKAVTTVGRAREEVRQEAQAGTVTGISKQEMLQLKISESLVESAGFDLISMGRPEGAGCYCYANNILKSIISQISGQYPFLVLDNEAGLENLSRRIMQQVDVLVIVSDASNAGLQTIVRLHGLADEMEIRYKKLVIIVNRLRTGTLPERMDEIKAVTGAELVIGLPDDLEVASFSENNKSFLNLSDDNPVVMKIDQMLKILNG